MRTIVVALALGVLLLDAEHPQTQTQPRNTTPPVKPQLKLLAKPLRVAR